MAGSVGSTSSAPCACPVVASERSALSEDRDSLPCPLPPPFPPPFPPPLPPPLPPPFPPPFLALASAGARAMPEEEKSRVTGAVTAAKMTASRRKATTDIRRMIRRLSFNGRCSGFDIRPVLASRGLAVIFTRVTIPCLPECQS
ncbi:hypothetical protein EUU22_09145 [Ciceribacter ferrooxidans]|uniref:Uncharacterized protein n=1 Tax=Ciceribacter ferrooxidans TaxID=2509717 RepID=A0A4Q2T9N4_9HYPH|nr:hypothetical protein EUU22_09145 [Ciceribacter ferrooxidans]